VLVTLAAILADAAAIGLPAHADPLADLTIPNRSPDCRHRADDLVARDKRVLAHAPVVIDEVNIAETDAAVRDLDFDLVLSELASVVFVRQ
jgi:hypothetical protein